MTSRVVKVSAALGSVLLIAGVLWKGYRSVNHPDVLELRSRVPFSPKHQASDAQYRALAEGIGQFGAALLAGAPFQNLLVGPLDLTLGLNLVLTAADGDNRAELMRVLRVAPGAAPLSVSLHRAELELPPGRITPRRAAIWLDASQHVLPGYLDTLATHWGMGVHQMRAGQFSGALEHWAAEGAGRHVPSRNKALTAPGLMPEGVVVSVSSTISADWEVPFPRTRSGEREFRLADGRTIHVPCVDGTASYAYLETPDFEMAELRYQAEDTSLLLVLPTARGEGLPPNPANLTASVAEHLPELRKQMVETKLRVVVPKVQLGTAGSVLPRLQTLGLESSTKSHSGGFPAIASRGEKLYLQDVVGIWDFRIGELGVADAATDQEAPCDRCFDLGIGTKELWFSRPFGFLVRRGPFVMLLGVVVEPR